MTYHYTNSCETRIVNNNRYLDGELLISTDNPMVDIIDSDHYIRISYYLEPNAQDPVTEIHINIDDCGHGANRYFTWDSKSYQVFSDFIDTIRKVTIFNNDFCKKSSNQCRREISLWIDKMIAIHSV